MYGLLFVRDRSKVPQFQLKNINDFEISKKSDFDKKIYRSSYYLLKQSKQFLPKIFRRIAESSGDTRVKFNSSKVEPRLWHRPAYLYLHDAIKIFLFVS